MVHSCFPSSIGLRISPSFSSVDITSEDTICRSGGISVEASYPPAGVADPSPRIDSFMGNRQDKESVRGKGSYGDVLYLVLTFLSVFFLT